MNNFIWVKKNVLSEKFCDHLIDKFEQSNEKVQGVVGHGLDMDIKQSMDLKISHYDIWREEDNILCEILRKNVKEYLKFIPKEAKPFMGYRKTSDTGYQIQKTVPGGFYTWHDDFHNSENLGGRILTYIWYLNTIKNDGYTEFVNGRKIQPETGKMLIFPATWTYAHRGYPPKNQTKYICTGWIYNY